VNELADVFDVWLTTAVNSNFTAFVSVAGQTSQPAPVVSFGVKGKIKASAADTGGEK
jgi:hypothetical protein